MNLINENIVIFVMGLVGSSYPMKAEALTVAHHSYFNAYNKQRKIMKEINLTNSKSKLIVDDDDYLFLNRFKWKLTSSGYVYRSHDNTNVSRIILGVEKSPKQVDHKKRNPLDNRKDNLRLANFTQNSANRSPKNIGKYKGGTYLPEYRKRKDKNGRIYYSKVDKRYRAMLKHNGINFCLGFYYTPEEAAISYDRKAYELYGEFAYINLPDKLIK